MPFLCTMMGHTANTSRHQNQGLEFSSCHHCECDLIRFERHGDWAEVPAGFRVVWREFGRSEDAASVGRRMARMTPAVRRRESQATGPKPRSARRGRPLHGAGAMLSTFANLGKLVNGDEQPDTFVEQNGQYVICLPAGRAH